MNIHQHFDGSWRFKPTAEIPAVITHQPQAGCNILLAWTPIEYRHCKTTGPGQHLHWAIKQDDPRDEWPNHYCGTCIKHEKSQTPV